MKKIILQLSILLIAISLQSCKDFLEEESETSFTSSTLFETKEGLEKMVLALYSYERGMVTKGDNSVLAAVIFGERVTDLVVFFTGTDAGLSRYASPGSSSGQMGLLYSPYWTYRYYIIGRTNEIIHYGEKLGDDTKEIVAEASFWRAYCYYGLYSRFSKLYLTTEPVLKENLENLTYQPADSAVIFNLMYDDLNKAIEGLPYTAANNMTGRVTKATARHLKALVAAWAKDWQTVTEQVDAIDTDSNYALNLVPDPSNIFNSSDLYTSETLWALRFSNVRGGGGGHRMGSQYGNSIAEQKFTHKIINGTLVKYHEENLGKQWGVALPNSYLISLYPENDKRLNAYYKTHYTYQNPQELITIPVSEPTLVNGVLVNSTTNFSGAPYQVHLGDTIFGRDIFAATRSKIDRRSFLPSSLKLIDIWSKPLDTDNGSASFKDIMIFRLAETYLLGAEAYMHLNNQAKARDYYNRTWTRAGNDPEAGTVTFEMIKNEHARELAFEGRRWDFLKRNGIWYQQMRSYAGDFTKYPESSLPYNPATYGISDGRDPKFKPNPDYYFDFNGADTDVLVRFNVQPFHKNWPIPQDQIDAMGAENFPQNPGY
ncbi:MAG: RagB/SusD family nutrient uptake outer membrane protein [Mangrovibacterium sp.]